VAATLFGLEKTMLEKTAKPLRFLQIGDLHLTGAGSQNHTDLLRIVDEVNDNTAGRVDFVYLPGDNADDGTPEQFRVVHDELSRLISLWHAIPGDHDFKQRSLDNFYAGLHVRKLPYVVELSGYRCIFLDVVSRGTGGPDFRLGAAHLVWLRGQLAAAQRDGKTVAVFMHAYPADLGEEGTELAAMFDESPVALVSMGHTHYNEISNDGRTIYAATRSTGQIEEGDVGFAFATVDAGVVSWRFKPLQSSWPFVMITSPADRRLAIAPHPAKKTIPVRSEPRRGAPFPSRKPSSGSTIKHGDRWMAAMAVCSPPNLRLRTERSG
jgi:Icc protein